jgi:hypothetical protein
MSQIVDPSGAPVQVGEAGKTERIRTMKFEYQVTESQLHQLKRFALITQQDSIADFMAFAVNEYMALLSDTLARTAAAAAAAERGGPGGPAVEAALPEAAKPADPAAAAPSVAADGPKALDT